MRTFPAAFLFALTTLSCSTVGVADEGPLRPPLAPEAQQPVSVTRLAHGADPLTYYSGITEPVRLVVRDAAVWREAWSRIWAGASAPTLPTVDFSREMLIIAALGRRPSGGYSIAIENAYREGGTLHVTIRTEAPATNCMSTNALTSPVDVARVTRTDGNVEFHEKSVTRDCP